jgi:hypothetical protein
MEMYFATLGDAEVDEMEVVVSQLVTVAPWRAPCGGRTSCRAWWSTSMTSWRRSAAPRVASEGLFVLEGRRVKSQHTPEDLNMVSGDKIDFFVDLLAAW